MSWESQLDRWAGEFGREYTDRNRVDYKTRVDTLARLIPPDVHTVLEVGCNSGHNLEALEAAFGKHMRVFGTEPAAYARQQARDKGLLVYDYSIYDIRMVTQFDLVMTSGVLIHIPPERLDEALRSIIRVSSRFVLAIEYEAVEDTLIPYRGHDDMLWKRDYGKHYERMGLSLVASGQDIPGFERATYWLLEK